MEKDMPSASSASSQNEKTDNSKKYNFYKKPSIKKKIPEVKQTLTSYKRMLNANPLMKYENEGKDLSFFNKHLPSSSYSQSKGVQEKLSSEKPSLQSNDNARKPLASNFQRSKSLRNPSKYKSNNIRPKTISKAASTIISGNKPNANINNVDISKQSNLDFNTSTSRFLCSTKLENTSGIQKNASAPMGPKNISKTKASIGTKDNGTSQGVNNNTSSNRKIKEKRFKPVRRSLSAQHFDRKRGVTTAGQEKSLTHDLTRSLNNISNVGPVLLSHDFSPIAEKSREASIVFKTPSAYERRSIAKFTPKSAMRNRSSMYHPATPLPSLNDLQKRLNDWLIKRGKCPSSFCHLKCFGEENDHKKEILDDENKENIEVDQDLNKDSYEDLKIITEDKEDCKNEKPILLTDENAECIAKAALDDLHKLIQEGYPRPQCEGWLELIRQKYCKLDEEPQYWECRAAIEQSRGNISNAVQCYKTAIVQGAEIQAVDESLDILLQKFSLLNISTDQVENEKSIRERARIVRDARNIFKSSIIQFAVQERKLKNCNMQIEKTKLVATPVRRSTRLSRTAYTSTPGVKICSSLCELDSPDRHSVNFQKNKALF